MEESTSLHVPAKTERSKIEDLDEHIEVLESIISHEAQEFVPGGDDSEGQAHLQALIDEIILLRFEISGEKLRLIGDAIENSLITFNTMHDHWTLKQNVNVARDSILSEIRHILNLISFD